MQIDIPAFSATYLPCARVGRKKSYDSNLVAKVIETAGFLC
jgi:hypothetical protein